MVHPLSRLLTVYSFFGAIRGAQPTGTYWADGLPHTAWYDMSEYSITAFKTDSYPAITVSSSPVYSLPTALTVKQKDVIYYWSKLHPTQATASIDGGRRPDGYDWSLVRLSHSRQRKCSEIEQFAFGV